MSNKSLNQKPKQEMVRMKSKLRNKIFGMLLFFTPLALMAETASGGTSDFKKGLASVMGIGAWFAFTLCFYYLIMGIMHWRQGGDFGKDIIGVVITAAAGTMCKVIFTIFGLGDATLTPTFTFIINNLSNYC